MRVTEFRKYEFFGGNEFEFGTTGFATYSAR
jgi:hypothetical protein